MFKYYQILFLLLLGAFGLVAQVDPEIDARLEKREHTFKSYTLPYRLHVPFGYDRSKQYPLLVFLHGAKWAGTDNITQLDNELALYWIDSTRQALQPCFVIYPQIPKGNVWEYTRGQVFDLPSSPELATANDIVTSVLQEFNIDSDRIYVCGKSIGALGVYGMLARYTERYAAAIPAAGYYLFRTIGELSNTALWIFHNKLDSSVSVEQPREIVAMLQNDGYEVIHTHCKIGESCKAISADSMDAVIRAGSRFIYSEFDDSGHQLEPNVVATYGLYEWVMAQHKSSMDIPHVNALPREFRLNVFPNPFNAGITIRYSLLNSADVHIDILNVMGQSVCQFECLHQPAGEFAIRWNGKDEAGNALCSGIYLCRLRIGNMALTKKMIMVQ